MIKVAITGPESTGKSWLAQNLAQYYNTTWVPEYAREFLGHTGGEYTYGDILTIAEGQFKTENIELRKASRLLFSDTEFLVTRIWCEVRFGKVHPWIEEMTVSHRYDLYLLCDIDLPWEYDPLREHPEMRQLLYDKYKAALDALNVNYSVVSGTGELRLKNAIEFVDSLLKNHEKK